MTIAEILAWLLAFAAAFAVLGAVDGLRRGVNPVRAAAGGLIAYAISLGLIALAVLIASPFLGVQP